ncbi:hypothetical protein [Sulfitobacter sp. S190]|uniref:hypothetical protein n=1 Tax=Sulfitobacter sp. S190 TaxID=2867022 RepID=UPI0021A52982|nr:hypothetical protein [Sulfitobacter sp. S190]UWR24603.1 hypothetical protein K3756_19450 [Sulfitobacter sp. S190]
MIDDKDEGVQVARLLSEQGGRVVGLVHLWNTAELSILWLDEAHEAEVIDPPLRPEIFESARAVNADAVFEYLEVLSKGSRR